MPKNQDNLKPSLDFCIANIFCGLLFIQGGLPLFSLKQKTLFAILELCFCLWVSRWNRQRNQWRWPGIRFAWTGIAKKIFNALISCLTILFGLFIWLIYARVAVFHGKPSFEHWSELLNMGQIGIIFTQEFQAIVNTVKGNGAITGSVMTAFGILISGVLISLGLIDKTQEEFTKHCRTPQPFQKIDLLGPLGLPLKSCIYDRPLTITKQSDSIELQFPVTSPQEMEQAWLIILIFVLFISCGLGSIIHTFLRSTPSAYFIGLETPQEWALQIFSAIFGFLLITCSPWVLWQWIIRNLFLWKVVNFNHDQLIVGEKLFGRYRKKIEIHKGVLQSLRESENTFSGLPGTKILYIQHPGKDVGLARLLIPAGMGAIQEVYDRYRTNNFASFYRDTDPLNLDLN
jgi:hypothetical protein